jgi:actin-related protein
LRAREPLMQKKQKQKNEEKEKIEKEKKAKEEEDRKAKELADFEEKKAQVQREIELDKEKIQSKQMVLDAISQFASAETGIGKALLIAKQALALKETIMDLKRITFKGAEAVGQAGVSAAQNVAESSKIGFPQNIITIAAAIGQGIGIIKSVKSAVSKTKAKATGGGSTGVSTPSAAATPSQPPQFNIVGAGGTNQLAEAIGSQEKQPVKAYVVSNDVTTAQSMDRNIVEGASI